MHLKFAFPFLFVTMPLISMDPSLPATPQALMELAKNASGGSAWDRVVSIQCIGELTTSGLQGRVEILENLGTGANLTQYNLGTVKGAEGFDGKNAWSLDPSGHAAIKKDGAELQDAANAAYLACRGYWFQGRWPAEMRLAGQRVDEGKTFLILEVLPRGGRTFELWVDARSWLIERTVASRDGQTETVRFTNFQDVEGLKVPFATHQTQGDSQFDTHVRLEKVVLNPAQDPTRFRIPSQPVQDGFDRNRTRTALPIYQDPEGHVYVQSRLNGKGPFWFCVDGGCSMSMLAPSVAKVLGLQGEGGVRLEGAGEASEAAGFLKIRETRIGAARMRNQVFAVVNSMGMLGSVAGEPCAGILGSDLFQTYVVKISYGKHRMVLYRAAPWTYRGRARGIPFVLKDGIPQVEGELDGIGGTFAIDTGSGSTLDVFAPFVAKHGLIAAAGTTYPARKSRGFGGEITSRSARAKELRIGDACLKGPLVSLGTMAKGTFAREDGIGNVGAGFLKRFEVTFDYRRQRLYLEPGTDFDAPDSFPNTHGLEGLAKEGTGFRVTALLVPSPLSEAGVKEGDVILGVNGISGSALAPGILDKALKAGVGTSLSLRIRTGDQERTVVITLRNLL